MTDARLKSYFDRINRLLDEKQGISGDISDVYQEVKSAGYVPKVLRKIIARHRADPSKVAEEDALQDLYESALDAKTRQAVEMAREGKSAREIEQATGISKSEVARTVPLKNESRDSEPDAEPVSRETEPTDMPAGLRDKIHGALVERYGAENVTAGPQGIEVTVTVPGHAPPDVADDDLTPPECLRRERATV